MRLFTIEEANRFLPEIQQILPQMQAVSTSIINNLKKVAETLGTEVCDPRVQFEAYKDAEISRLGMELDRLIKLIEIHGITVRSISRGIIEFPALLGGQVVVLCWQAGETEISWWHEVNASFAERKLLVDGPTFEEVKIRANLH